MTEPKPMSPEERRKLMHALADGKVCLVEYKVIAYTTTIRERFRLTDMGALQHHTDTRGWQCVGAPGFSGQLISWSEVREPRVWEGETTTTKMFLGDLPGQVAAFGICIDQKCPIPTKVRYRVEEILEETT